MTLPKIAFELPLNSLSFGNISLLVLRTLFEQQKINGSKYDIYLFPIGNVDLKSQTPNKEFFDWINTKIKYSIENYTRDINIFKLWHLNGGINSFAKNQTLLSFYELDEPSPAELNAARNNNTLFTSQYTCDVFANLGVLTKFLPLGFDSFNFQQLNKKNHQDGRITFLLCSKFEKRKQHAKAIQIWIKKFGGNSKYALQCAIYNPFLNEQQNQQVAAGIFQGQQKPFNVSLYPFMSEHIIYNEFLNSGDIIIGLGNESWGLPEFHAIAMGKHGVIMDCNGHKGWANSENAILVPPCGKESAVDGMFFHPNTPFNVGNNFVCSEDDIANSFDLAIKRVEQSRINTAGLTLQQTFSKEKFLNNILATF